MPAGSVVIVALIPCFGVEARDPANPSKVKVGDLIDITYSEALAVSLRPVSKKSEHASARQLFAPQEPTRCKQGDEPMHVRVLVER